MKFLPLAATLSLVVPLAISTAAWADAPETDAEKLGYMIGMDIGSSILQQGDEVDVDALVDAIRATVAGEQLAMTPEEASAFREAYVAKRQAAATAEQSAIAEQNRLEGEAFLAGNANVDGVVTTDSGLQYLIVNQGDGPTPTATDTVRVHYRGTLLDGTEFDSSYSRGEPIEFGLTRVIPGWTEGLSLMPVGSKYMLYVKPELGYGAAGGGPIPPNATLIFEVELLDIVSGG